MQTNNPELSMEQVRTIIDSITPGDGWGGDEWDFATAQAVAAFVRRAAAPVSGPSDALDDEPSEAEQLIACLGDDAATLTAQNPDDEMAQTMREAAEWITRASSKAISTAPVSGQGATLQMTEQQVAGALAENDPLTMVSIRRLLNGDPVTINLSELTRIVGHCIDSRPRSEDSRVSALEAARIAYASEFPLNADGEPDVGNIHANIRKLKAALASSAPESSGEVAGWHDALNLPPDHREVLIELAPRYKNSKRQFVVGSYFRTLKGVHDAEPGWSDSSNHEDINVLRWQYITATPSADAATKAKG